MGDEQMTDIDYLAALCADFETSKKWLLATNRGESAPPVVGGWWQAHEDATNLFIAVSHLYHNRGPLEDKSGLQAAWAASQA